MSVPICNNVTKVATQPSRRPIWVALKLDKGAQLLQGNFDMDGHGHKVVLIRKGYRAGGQLIKKSVGAIVSCHCQVARYDAFTVSLFTTIRAYKNKILSIPIIKHFILEGFDEVTGYGPREERKYLHQKVSYNWVPCPFIPNPSNPADFSELH